MVRIVKHKGKEYVIITTTFHTNNGEIEAPVQIQISLTNIDPKQHFKIYQQASYLLHRPIKLKSEQSKQTDSKPWWKIW
jgi:hypothetical protein